MYLLQIASNIGIFDIDPHPDQDKKSKDRHGKGALKFGVLSVNFQQVFSLHRHQS